MTSKLLILASGGVLIIVLAMNLPALAADGNLVELSIQTEMHREGMGPIPAASMKHKVCMRTARLEAQDLLTHQLANGCKIANYKIDGTLVTFDAICSKPEVRSHGEFHMTGAADFTGKVHTEMNTQGLSVTMDSSYTGKKIGSCNYVPPKE